MASRDDPFAFEPVLLRARRGGWSPGRQRAFIAALAETRCVRAACRRVAVAPESAYRLARRPDAAGFRRAWEEALQRRRLAGPPPRASGVPSWSLTGMMAAFAVDTAGEDRRQRHPSLPPSPSAPAGAEVRDDPNDREHREHRHGPHRPSPSPAEADDTCRDRRLSHHPATAPPSAAPANTGAESRPDGRHPCRAPHSAAGAPPLLAYSREAFLRAARQSLGRRLPRGSGGS